MDDTFTRLTQELKNTFDENFYTKARFIPSAADTIDIFERLKNYLFGYTPAGQPSATAPNLQALSQRLEKRIKNSLCFLCTQKTDCEACAQRARQITADFFAHLPAIQRLVLSDVTAAYEGDPAAVNPIEPLLCYPGILAVTFQRMAHFLHTRGVRLIPRIVTEYAHSNTGIDIHPGAQIGPSFFIDHGTGTVIGETCVIGANVKLYQGVTLGAKSFPLDERGNPVKGIKRHPNIEDDVIIYAETTVLGNITIGKGSIIGANKWITADVPPGSKI